MKRKEKVKLRMKEKRLLKKPAANDLISLILSCKDSSNLALVGIVLAKVSDMAEEPGMDIYLLKKEIDKALVLLNEQDLALVESDVAEFITQ